MKRLLTVLYALLFCLSTHSQISNPNLSRLIEHINANKTDSAMLIISSVQDWRFDIKNEPLLDINKGINFIELSDSLNIEKNNVDSLTLYLAKQTDAIGTLFYQKGDYKKSLAYIEIAEKLYKNSIGENNNKYANILGKLGILYEENNDYESAETYNIKALELCKKLNGQESEFYVTALNNVGSFYVSLRNNDAAITYFLKAVEIQQRLISKPNLRTVQIYNNLGIAYKNKNDYTEAEKYYNKSLESYKQFTNDSTSVYSSALENLALMLYNKGDFKKSEKYFLQVLEIYKNQYGEQHLEYADILSYLSSVYYELNDYKKAEDLQIQCVNITKKERGEKDIAFAQALINLGDFYLKTHQFENAEKNYLTAYNIYQSDNNRKNKFYPYVLNNIGTLYSSLGQFNKAETFYNEAIEINKLLYGEQSYEYANSMLNMGVLYRKKGDFKNAEKSTIQALTISKQINDNISIMKALSNISVIYTDLGDYQKALQYHNIALNEIAKTYGKQHPYYATNLDNIGAVYFTLNDFDKAYRYYSQAMAIRKKVFGETNLEYAYSINNIANVYAETENYEQAENLFLQALSIISTNYGNKRPQTFSAMQNLATLYNNLGDYDKAETYYLQTLQNQIDLYTENNPKCALTMHNLAVLYKKQSRYNEAEHYMLKSLKIREQSYGKESLPVATTLANLGNLYESMADNTKAEQYMLQAMNIRKNILGEQNSSYAHSLSNLASFYVQQGKLKKAKAYAKKAIDIFGQTLTDNHISYINATHNLCSVLDKQGDHKKMYKYFQHSDSVFRQKYLQTINYLSERQRINYWNTIQPQFETTYPYFAYKYHTKQPSLAGFAYDNELFVKGLLLTSTQAVKRSILQSNDTTLIQQYQKLVQLKEIITYLEENKPKSDIIKQYKDESENLEKQIISQSSTFRSNLNKMNIRWQDVKSKLAQNEIAIEFFTAPVTQETTWYCALLLNAESQYPTLIPLFNEKQINITNLSHRLNDEQYADTLKNIIWERIIPYLKNVQTIFFAPKGVLHQIPIENLLNENNNLNNTYNCIRLSSTREIINLKSESIQPMLTAALFGGIQYDVPKDSVTKENFTTNNNLFIEDTLQQDILRSINYNSLSKIKYLKGTKNEVDSIASILKNTQIKVTLFSQINANEEAFKALNGKNQNIIHIATHGFFLTDSILRQTSNQERSISAINYRTTISDPLYRCGLLFAGANNTLQEEAKQLLQTEQDGILTAKEISLIDLNNTDLVVLSACDTGKGEITSEGVFGLQRAFKQAGANTIIMSLWPVNDQATQMLMTAFYKNYIQSTNNNISAKRDAFRKAQEEVKQTFEEPIYWAGFIILD